VILTFEHNRMEEGEVLLRDHCEKRKWWFKM